MPVREIRNGRPASRRRVVREIRRVVPVPVPDEIEADDVPASGAAASSRDTARRPRRTVLATLVLLAAALAGLGVTGQQWYQQRRLEAARQGALAAAKQTTVDFVSISAATVDRDLQRISTGATGDFKDEFTRNMAQARTAVVENKVSSAGSVLRAALVSADLDSAVVLVAIDVSVRNTGAPDGRVSHFRIQVDLSVDPTSGRWLVSRLQFVG
jgi:Mce-associated membrane protein